MIGHNGYDSPFARLLVLELPPSQGAHDDPNGGEDGSDDRAKKVVAGGQWFARAAAKRTYAKRRTDEVKRPNDQQDHAADPQAKPRLISKGKPPHVPPSEVPD
jgi:hypothetical protein